MPVDGHVAIIKVALQEKTHHNGVVGFQVLEVMAIWGKHQITV
jgi:hypothetical protein